jgi:cyclic beta-1,2-glucan synthetase
MQLALMAIDAIVRAVWRTAVSRRRLLEWTTAAAAQASATTHLPTLLRKHWGVVLAAIGLWAWLLAIRTPYPLFAGVLCVAWALSPVWTWWVSRPRPLRRADALSPTDRDYLLGVARETWRLFERCVVPEDHHLPPDNLQIAPHDMVAHRTSPTNIGLYLLATVCAREYGWIGGKDALARLEATLSGLQTLPQLVRHRAFAGTAAAVRLQRRQRQPLHASAGGGPGLPRVRGGARRRFGAAPRADTIQDPH